MVEHCLRLFCLKFERAQWNPYSFFHYSYHLKLVSMSHRTFFKLCIKSQRLFLLHALHVVHTLISERPPGKTYQGNYLLIFREIQLVRMLSKGLSIGGEFAPQNHFSVFPYLLYGTCWDLWPFFLIIVAWPHNMKFTSDHELHRSQM